MIIAHAHHAFIVSLLQLDTAIHDRSSVFGINKVSVQPRIFKGFTTLDHSQKAIVRQSSDTTIQYHILIVSRKGKKLLFFHSDAAIATTHSELQEHPHL